MYIPALKGKMGELEALRNLSGFDATLPLLEVVDANEGGAQRLGGYLRKLQGGVSVALDGGNSGGEALSGVEEEMRRLGEVADTESDDWSISVIPVVRYENGYSDLDVFQQLNEKYQSGYLLRLGSVEADPDIAEADSRVPLLLDGLAVEPGQIDLVLDYAEVDSRQAVERATPRARDAVEWAASRNWRSITLLSGSFPKSISHLEYDYENLLPRFEVDLWNSIASEAKVETNIHYGDYATNNPAPPSGVVWQSHPNLRYARGEKWAVYRTRPTKEQGNSTFYDICQTVVDHPAWEGPSFSWADQQIDEGTRTHEGLGSATKWVALGRSRHLEVVKHRLATLGAP